MILFFTPSLSIFLPVKIIVIFHMKFNYLKQALFHLLEKYVLVGTLLIT